MSVSLYTLLFEKKRKFFCPAPGCLDIIKSNRSFYSNITTNVFEVKINSHCGVIPQFFLWFIKKEITKNKKLF